MRTALQKNICFAVFPAVVLLALGVPRADLWPWGRPHQEPGMQRKAGDAGAGEPAMHWTTTAAQRQQPAKDSRPEKGQVGEKTRLKDAGAKSRWL